MRTVQQQEEAELALNILSRFAREVHWFKPWDEGLQIDGSVGNLTTEEVSLVRRLRMASPEFAGDDE